MTAIAMTANPDIRLSFSRVTRSEWIKYFTLRSTYWALGLTIVLWVGMTTAILSQGGSMSNAGSFYAEAPIGLYQIGLFVLPICAAICITNEYNSGMIRTTVASVPRRLPVLASKAVVIAIVSAVVSAVSIGLNLALTMLFGGDAAKTALTSESLERYGLAIVVITAMSLIALGIGFLLRNTAGSIGAALGLFMLAPMLFEMAQSITWLYNLRHYLPTEAANALIGYSYGEVEVSQLQGGITLAVWVAASLWAAAVVLRRRDV